MAPGDDKRRIDRTFADALRDAAKGSCDGLIWHGGVLDQRVIKHGQGCQIPPKDSHQTDSDDWHTTLEAVWQAKTSGCFTAILVLLGLGVFGQLYSFGEVIAGLYHQGLLQLAMRVPVILLCLVMLGVWCMLIIAGAKFLLKKHKEYGEMLRGHLDTIPIARLAVPAEDELGETYDRLPKLLQQLIGGKPGSQRTWTLFLSNNVDLYLEKVCDRRVTWVEWAARYWLFFWFFGAVFGLPELLIGSSLIRAMPYLKCMHETLYELMPSYSSAVVLLFIGHAHALRDEKVRAVHQYFVTRLKIPGRGAGLNAGIVSVISENPALNEVSAVVNRLHAKYRQLQEVGSLGIILLLSILFGSLVMVQATLYSSGRQQGLLNGGILVDLTFAAAVVLVSLSYIARRARRNTLLDRVRSSDIIEKLANGGDHLDLIFQATPWPWRWFLGHRPVTLSGWVRLLAYNLDWFLKRPRPLFRLGWVVQVLLIPLVAVQIMMLMGLGNMSGPLLLPFSQQLLGLICLLSLVPVLNIFDHRTTLEILGSYIDERMRETEC